MQLDLLEFLHTAIVSDSDLQTIVGGDVDLRYTYQVGETDYPYFFHNWVTTVIEPWGVFQGVWSVHTLDNDADGKRSIEMHTRVKELFDRRYYCEIDNISGVRIFLEGETFLSENEDRVWHNVLRFGIRYTDDRHIRRVTSERTPIILS